MHEFETRERADQNEAASDYDRLYHGFPLAEYWDDDFVEFVRPHWHDGDRILDLGCGPASLYDRWAHLPTPDRLVGIDISDRMIDEARVRYPEAEFVTGRAHELPFDNGSFDIVIASSVLHHIPDEHLDGAIEEIVRVLDEHGRLIGREPVSSAWGHRPGWLSGTLMTFRHLAFRLTGSREYPEPELGDHHHVFEEQTLRAALKRHLHLSASERRFPFSPLLLRVRDERVARLAKEIDDKLRDRAGEMFYFVAQRNYATAADVSYAVMKAREEVAPISDAEFLALVQAAAIELERIFAVSEDA